MSNRMGTADAVSTENEGALARLERQLASPFRVIPFVGAGVSTPYVSLGWSDFLKDVAGRFGILSDIDRLLAENDFEGAADRLATTCTESGLQLEISRCFGDHVARNRPLVGVLPLLPDLTAGPVATTNYDRLIERVFDERGAPLKVLRGGDLDTTGRALNLLSSFVLKLHGDAEERTGRILTRAEYERHYGAPGAREDETILPLPGLLHRIMGGYVLLLFLGCSLVKDRTLEILKRAHLLSAYSLNHFAFQQIPKDATTLPERRQFLSSLGISPIWYPAGKHEEVESLLRGLLERRDRRGASAHPPSPVTEGEARVLGRIDELTSTFVGRERELAQLEDHAFRPVGVPLLVTAEAGQGKSALLAKMVVRLRGRGANVAAHFFSRQEGLTSPAEGYDSLIRQIARLRGTPVGFETAAGREGLWRALVEWSKGEAAAPLIVVVDALDEADNEWRRPGPSKLPAHVALIVSARAVEEEDRPDLAEWSKGAERLWVSRLSKHDVQAWLRVWGARATPPDSDERLALAVVRTTDGIGLHVRLVAEEIARRAASGSPVTAEQVDRLPTGFNAYVEWHLQEILRDQAAPVREEAKKVFALLCAARGPLDDADLMELAGVSALELPWRVTRWFVSQRDSDGTITHRFGHDRLSRAFAERLGRSAVARAEGALVGHCDKWAENGSRYALRHYADHLWHSGAHEKLLALARDGRFRQAQMVAFPDEPALLFSASERVLEQALETDDAVVAAEMLLSTAAVAASSRAQGPLDALRSHNLARARALVDLYAPADRVLWSLMLCGELLDAGRTTAARDLLDSLEAGSVPRIPDWKGHVAVVLLAQAQVPGAGRVWRSLATKILNANVRSGDDPRLEDLAEVLVRQGALDVVKPLLPEAGRLESWCLALVRAGRYAEAEGSVRSVARKHQEARWLAMAKVAIEASDPDHARQWLESARRSAIPDRRHKYPEYADALMAERAALEIAVRDAHGEETLRGVVSPGQRVKAISTAIRLGAASAERQGAGSRWTDVEVTLATIGSQEERLGALTDAARAAVAGDPTQARAWMADAVVCASGTAWDERAHDATTAWRSLAELSAELGDLEGAVELLRRVPSHYFTLDEDLVGSWVGRLMPADADGHQAKTRAFELLDEARGHHCLGPATAETRAHTTLPIVETLIRAHRGTDARRLVADLLHDDDRTQIRGDVKRPLRAVAQILVDAGRGEDAMEAAALSGDLSYARYCRCAVAESAAKRGDNARALELLADDGASPIGDKARLAVVTSLTANDKLQAAKAVHNEMQWGTREWFVAKMKLLAVMARQGELHGVSKELHELGANEAVTAGIVDVASACTETGFLEDFVKTANDLRIQMLGWAQLAVACFLRNEAQSGKETGIELGKADAQRFLAQAWRQAAAASAHAIAEDSLISRAASRPWIQLAGELHRMRLAEEGQRAFAMGLRQDSSVYDRDEDALALVRELAIQGAATEAFTVAKMISRFEQAGAALTAISSLDSVPTDFTAHIEDRVREIEDEGQPPPARWAAHIWAARGDRTRLRFVIASRSLDRATAEDLCEALTRLRPDAGLAIARILASRPV